MPTILVIDDEPTVRQLLHDILCDEGFAVVTVADGLEGFVALRTVLVDLILCDIMMPRMDGIAFATQLRGESRYVAIPLIMLSAAPAENSLLATMYTAFLEKPFAVPALLTVVNQALSEPAIPPPFIGDAGIAPPADTDPTQPVASA
ncbi:MAG: response regulator [Herpetosiphonaceae bacterium]|nr:response regulator [Herpetosiphonaceae bacterium]